MFEESFLARLSITRTRLENMLTPEVSATVIFQALERFGDDLPHPMALRRFETQELRHALVMHLGENVAQQVISTLAVNRPRNSREYPGYCLARSGVGLMSRRPVTVAVLAASSRMKTRLSAAMGPRVTKTLEVRDVSHLPVIAKDFGPLLVLLDGTDPPPYPASALLDPLRLLPDDVLLVIYGAGEPWAKQAVEAINGTARNFVALDHSQGVHALLNVIRSRHVVPWSI